MPSVRKDAENSLRSHQCEMAEMRSKLLRKENAGASPRPSCPAETGDPRPRQEQALLEASGLKERPQLTWQSSARGRSRSNAAFWLGLCFFGVFGLRLRLGGVEPADGRGARIRDSPESTCTGLIRSGRRLPKYVRDVTFM